jgi:hypothetical protein
MYRTNVRISIWRQHEISDSARRTVSGQEERSVDKKNGQWTERTVSGQEERTADKNVRQTICSHYGSYHGKIPADAITGGACEWHERAILVEILIAHAARLKLEHVIAP